MKTTTAQHTPTPWVLDKLSGGDLPALFHINGGAVEVRSGKMDAAFIVRAVNGFEEREAELKRLRDSHEQLLELAKDALCELDPDCNYDGSNYKGEPSEKANPRVQLILALYDAIAKADGK